MGSSRKRQRELKRLKGSAAAVAAEQRKVLDDANAVLREASRQLGRYARDDVAPRVQGAYDENLRPRIAQGVAVGRAAATTGRARLADDIIPAITGALGSTIAVLEAAKDPRVRDAAKKAGAATRKAGSNVSKSVRPAKTSGPGPGRYILLGFGVVAVAAIAYAAWQTLRADDDLWIEDVADVEPASSPEV